MSIRMTQQNIHSFHSLKPSIEATLITRHLPSYTACLKTMMSVILWTKLSLKVIIINVNNYFVDKLHLGHHLWSIYRLSSLWFVYIMGADIFDFQHSINFGTFLYTSNLALNLLHPAAKIGLLDSLGIFLQFCIPLLDIM